jgi:hypothetical protein
MLSIYQSIAIAVALMFGMAFKLTQPVSTSAQMNVNSFVADNIRQETNTEFAKANTIIQNRSGYWVQVARNASVRQSPGGPEVKQGFRLQPGQYFHVETRGGTASWALGFACPNGGRFCNSRENLPGFVLRSALGARISANTLEEPVKATFAAFYEPEIAGTSLNDVPHFMPAGYISPNTAERTVTSAAATTRTVCAREVWVRNDRLHPIGVLRKGERFAVERYTDGSGNSGNPVWALGRAYGRGVVPQGAYGRVMVSSLCR